MNSDCGVVPERPWPRSCVSEGEEDGGVSLSSGSLSASVFEEESEGEAPAGQSVDASRDSHIVSSGASKNASRYVELAVRTSNGVFPVPTTVTGLV